VLEDRTVTAAGSFAATASLKGNSGWVMQAGAFRAALSTPPDTQPPTAPATPRATAVATDQISLSWTASTDDVGVTEYLIERCQGAGCKTFAQIATSTSTAYNNVGLLASTSYSYRVRATDCANNLSAYLTT